jgi:hypothetical protein
MSDRAAYSRVYWSVIDDPKFVSVYDDDRLLATWLRLLLAADQSHPASANIPHGTRRASVTALAKAGLIDLGSASRYRIHGLDAERERRRLAATSRPPKGTGPGPDGDRSGTGRSANGSDIQGLRRDEGETSQDETTARADDEDRWDAPEQEALIWLAKHGCDIRPGNGYHQKLITAVETHGVEKMLSMFDRLADAGTVNGDIKGFLFKAIDQLNAQTRPDLRALEKEDDAERESLSTQRRVENTQRLLHENGAHQDSPRPACPLCKAKSA